MNDLAFCFGLGYVGRFWAEAMLKQKYQVSGTSRSPKRDTKIKIWHFDGHNPIPKDILYQHSHFLITIPPTETGDVVLNQHRADLLAAHPGVKWIGYISGTGVYGDHQGDWVDETSECNPTFPIFQRRLKAENDWLKLYKQASLPVHIFRCSGIYGPNRSMIDRVINNEAERIDKPGHFISRIHVDDIIQVLLASIQNPQPGEIYNLADESPCSTREVIEYICDRLGRPYPPFIPFECSNLSDMGKVFYADNRRVRNHKIKTDLAVQLKYPSYKEGLEEELSKLIN